MTYFALNSFMKPLLHASEHTAEIHRKDPVFNITQVKVSHSYKSASYLSFGVFCALFKVKYLKEYVHYYKKNTNSLNTLQQHLDAWMRLGSLCQVLYKHIWKVISYRRIYKQHLQDWGTKQRCEKEQ